MTETDLLKRLDSITTNAELFEVLNLAPPESWINESLEIPGYRFLAIEKVEMLLWKIFGFNHRTEVLEHKQTFNSVSVAMRVWFKDFDNKEWSYFDGISAEEPETNDKEFTPYSIAKSLPSAKSNAIKNACLSFGTLFGNGLNRNKQLQPQETKQNNAKMLAELIKLLEEKRTKIKYEDQLHYDRIIEDKETENYAKSIKELNSIK